MQKNKKVIITSVVALAVASCVILTSFALKSNSVSADNVGNELSINDESIEMIFEELEKIKTLIKSGDNTLGFGDTEEALYLYELALSGLDELDLSSINTEKEEPEYETIINEIETIAKELTYKIEEVKNSLESEESSTENNSVPTTSTNTTTSNNTTNTNTNSNSSSANTSTSTSGSTNNNSSNSNISTPTETTTTSDSSNSNSNNSNTSSDNTNSSTESTTNSNNSSNSTSTPNNNTTSSTTPKDGDISADGTKIWIDGFGWVDNVVVDGGGMQEAHFELTGEIVGH